jgi:hypothetical protein
LNGQSYSPILMRGRLGSRPTYRCEGRVTLDWRAGLEIIRRYRDKMSGLIGASMSTPPSSCALPFSPRIKPENRPAETEDQLVDTR